MKKLLCLFLLASGSSYGSSRCSIDFENEISQNTEVHNLFKSVKVNESILSRKGFHLVSASGPLPSWTADISIKQLNGMKSLSLILHNMTDSMVHHYQAPYTTGDVSVQRLLMQMDSCR